MNFLRICLFIGGILQVASASSFDSDTDLSLRFPVAPSCPALSILGSKQDMISPPVDPVDVAVSLVTGSGEIKLPDQFAVEVSPYWLFNSDSEESFLDFEETSSRSENALQGMTASMAYGPTPGDSSAHSFAIGFRVPLITGKTEEEYSDLVRLYNDLQTELLRLTDDAVIGADLITGLPIFDIYSEARRQLEELQDTLDHFGLPATAGIEQIRNRITGTELRRTGWTLDFSTAVLWNISESDSIDKGLMRYGAWLSGGYEMQHITTAGIVRFIGEAVDDSPYVIDTGGRIIFNNLSFLRLSGETVHRYAPDELETSQWRFAGNVQLPIGANRAIDFTFGKDFSAIEEDNNFMSAGITVGLGSSRPVFGDGNGFSR